jgi:hypothetical protein
MDPATLALIGSSIASVGSSILGVNSTNKQYKLQLEEMLRQGLISQKQLDLAERQIELGLATQIDAAGNTLVYDKDTNTFKATLSPKSQQLQDASDNEYLRMLNYDAPMARGEAMRNSARRAKEGIVADGMLQTVQDQQRGIGARKPEEIASLLRMSRTQAVNGAFDQVGTAAATQAQRSGATAAAGQQGRLAQARAQAMAQIMGTPEVEGIQAADDLQANKQGNGLNNYNLMAGRASSGAGFGYTPTSVAPTLNATLNNLRSGGQAGAANAAAGFANAGRPIQQPQVPNYAQTVAALGNSFSDLFRDYYSNSSRSRNLGNSGVSSIGAGSNFGGGNSGREIG